MFELVKLCAKYCCSLFLDRRGACIEDLCHDAFDTKQTWRDCRQSCHAPTSSLDFNCFCSIGWIRGRCRVDPPSYQESTFSPSLLTPLPPPSFSLYLPLSLPFLFPSPPLLPPFSIPFLLLPFPLPSPNPVMGSGGALRAQSQPKLNLVHFKWWSGIWWE